MKLSQVAQSCGESATLRLNSLTQQLRQRGEPVIHLGGGEPTSKAPPEAIQRCAALLETGEIRYAPPDGIPALKKAICGYTQQFYERGVEPANVMASGGAKQAIMVCLQAVLDPGDEVVFPTPYWVSYPDMVRLAMGVPVAVRTRDPGFQPAIGEIEAAITQRTRVVIINSPNNPSGVVYQPGFVADVVRLCEQRDLYLIMDDIYHRLLFDGLKPTNCYAFTQRSVDDSKLVLANSVSKQYAMTGFRVGWAVGNRQLIKAMGNMQGHQTSGPSVLTQTAAVGALTGEQSAVENLRTALESARDLACAAIRAIPLVRLTQPSATFYSFADFSAYSGDSLRLAEFLLEKVKVVTVPGVEFGMDGFLRISFCSTPADIREGIDRIRWALDPSQPGERRIGEQTVTRDWDPRRPV